MSDLIPHDVRDAVLDRLGFSEVPDADLDGLTSLYRAWCRRVPFDNIRKLIAFGSAAPGPLPGGAADDFFDAWLIHGTGGTCWPSSNALATLLETCSFDVRRVAGSMFETGELNHGSAIVSVDDGGFLVDSSMLTDVPLELVPGGATVADPVHPMIAESVGEQWRFRFGFVFEPEGTPVFWLLMADPSDHTTYLERYEHSRESSVFNDARFARRNEPGGVRALVKDARFTKTPAGLEIAADLDGDAQDRVLVEELGFSEEIVSRLRQVMPGSSTSGA